VFFYYLPGLLRKTTRGLGSDMHSGGFVHFAECFIGEANKCDERTKECAAAYFCGYITHYALDTTAHPYIYFRTGSNKSIKNSVRHRKFETNIDTLILKLVSGTKPRDKKLWRLLYEKRRKTRAVSAILAKSVNLAYKKNINIHSFSHAFSYMAQITRFLQSKNGAKKRFFQIAEDLTVGEHYISSIIHDNDVCKKRGMDFLNTAKKAWHFPLNKSDVRNDTFIELFERAVKDAAAMAEAFFYCMEGEITPGEFAAVTGDKSFTAGI
jgi:hypothetical protein